MNILEYTKEEGFICLLALMAAVDLVIAAVSDLIGAADVTDAVDVTDVAEAFGSNNKN